MLDIIPIPLQKEKTITTAKPRSGLDIPNALTKVSKVLFQASLHLFLWFASLKFWPSLTGWLYRSDSIWIWIRSICNMTIWQHLKHHLVKKGSILFNLVCLLLHQVPHSILRLTFSPESWRLGNSDWTSVRSSKTNTRNDEGELIINYQWSFIHANAFQVTDTYLGFHQSLAEGLHLRSHLGLALKLFIRWHHLQKQSSNQEKQTTAQKLIFGQVQKNIFQILPVTQLKW